MATEVGSFLKTRHLCNVPKGKAEQHAKSAPEGLEELPSVSRADQLEYLTAEHPVCGEAW